MNQLGRSLIGKGLNEPHQEKDFSEEKMKKWVLMVMAAAFTLSVSACSTVKGVGQDVSAVGDDIDTAATAVQKKL